MPGPCTRQPAPGLVSVSGGRWGGFENGAGPVSCRQSVRSAAFASRQVSAGRFQRRSIRASTEVWS